MKNNNEWKQIMDRIFIINPDERPDIDEIIKIINNLSFKNTNYDEKYFNLNLIKEIKKIYPQKSKFEKEDCFDKLIEINQNKNYNEEHVIIFDFQYPIFIFEEMKLIGKIIFKVEKNIKIIRTEKQK